jgi:hypothetical protein
MRRIVNGILYGNKAGCQWCLVQGIGALAHLYGYCRWRRDGGVGTPA